MNEHTPAEPLTPEGLEAALRAIGPERYHDLHPFHDLFSRRQAQQGPGPGVGAQPLRLSGSDPTQGRVADRPLR